MFRINTLFHAYYQRSNLLTFLTLPVDLNAALNYNSRFLSDKDTKYPLTVLVRKLPNPMIIKKGQKFDVSVTINVTRKLPSKFHVDLDLWRKALFWIKLPCIKNAGSWWVSKTKLVYKESYEKGSYGSEEKGSYGYLVLTWNY